MWDARDGTDRKWHTRSQYFRNTDTWETQHEITATQTELIVQQKIHAPCDRVSFHPDDNVPCFRRDIVHHVICVSEEPDRKYRVQIQEEGLVLGYRNCVFAALIYTISKAIF